MMIRTNDRVSDIQKEYTKLPIWFAGNWGWTAVNYLKKEKDNLKTYLSRQTNTHFNRS